MQRLFSTFANGWPGRGLLLQRSVTAAILFHYSIVRIGAATPPVSIVLHMIAAGAGVLLLVGLWTPVAGTMIAVLELWIAFFIAGGPLLQIMLATSGATLAMIGPGAWSVDARLFGRKQFQAPRR